MEPVNALKAAEGAETRRPDELSDEDLEVVVGGLARARIDESLVGASIAALSDIKAVPVFVAADPLLEPTAV